MRHFLYSIIVVVVSCTLLQAQTLSELNKRRKKAEEEISYIDKLLKTNASKKKSGLEQLGLTQQKIRQRRQMIADIDLQIHLVEHELKNKNRHITGLQNHLQVLKQSYENLIYQAYKLRGQHTWIMFVLSSDNFGMAYRRWQYFRRFSEHINELAQNIKETTGKINSEITLLTTKKQELAGLLAEKHTEVNKLQQEEKESQKAVDNLTGQEQQLRKQLERQRKEIEKINKQIERLVVEEAKKKRKDGSPLPVDHALSANFESNRGNLPWPVRKGVVTSRFGRHPHPVYKGVELPPNNGIHITTEANSAAISVFKGKVTSIVNIPGMNNCVMVRHGEYFTVYCKLGALSVRPGDEVQVGQNLGTIVTDNENNTILHFQLWKGTTKQNPELWLAK
ncbi:MAG: peptidoglycan DD-metalloendopeptidase family protein [Prevotellaceae bacterium]|jgi:septal ring factor EnvC (AmiA/AmiB activator)|nr:peptidoglycan DD-metalloendopeptidase family protein [Prevotellaceae bacterium]